MKRTHTVGRKLLIAFVVLLATGATMTYAQTLSGSRLLFGIPIGAPSSESPPPVSPLSGTGGVRFFRTASSLSAVTGETEPSTAGVNMRMEEFPSQGQTMDIPLLSYHLAITEDARGRIIPEMTVMMPENLASPRLFVAAMDGQRLGRAHITVRGANGGNEYVRWTLSGVTIASYATESARGEALPFSTLRLTAERIEELVTPLLQNGAAGTPVWAGWDIKKNKAL